MPQQATCYVHGPRLRSTLLKLSTLCVPARILSTPFDSRIKFVVCLQGGRKETDLPENTAVRYVRTLLRPRCTARTHSLHTRTHRGTQTQPCRTHTFTPHTHAQRHTNTAMPYAHLHSTHARTEAHKHSHDVRTPSVHKRTRGTQTRQTAHTPFNTRTHADTNKHFLIQIS